MTIRYNYVLTSREQQSCSQIHTLHHPSSLSLWQTQSNQVLTCLNPVCSSLSIHCIPIPPSVLNLQNTFLYTLYVHELTHNSTRKKPGYKLDGNTHNASCSAFSANPTSHGGMEQISTYIILCTHKSHQHQVTHWLALGYFGHWNADLQSIQWKATSTWPPETLFPKNGAHSNQKITSKRVNSCRQRRARYSVCSKPLIDQQLAGGIGRKARSMWPQDTKFPWQLGSRAHSNCTNNKPRSNNWLVELPVTSHTSIHYLTDKQTMVEHNARSPHMHAYPEIRAHTCGMHWHMVKHIPTQLLVEHHNGMLIMTMRMTMKTSFTGKINKIKDSTQNVCSWRYYKRAGGIHTNKPNIP